MSVQRWRTDEEIQEGTYSLVYWREGIGAVYDGGHFLVESYQELVSRRLVARCGHCVSSRDCNNNDSNGRGRVMAM